MTGTVWKLVTEASAPHSWSFRGIIAEVCKIASIYWFSWDKRQNNVCGLWDPSKYKIAGIPLSDFKLYSKIDTN